MHCLENKNQRKQLFIFIITITFMESNKRIRINFKAWLQFPVMVLHSQLEAFPILHVASPPERHFYESNILLLERDP